jgi:hypothetical protein
MSQAGLVDFEGSHPQVPTSFVTNTGTAVPIGNTLELLATTVAAHGVPIETTGAGNVVTIEQQYASSSATSIAANAGVASFNSGEFTVDANGFVSLLTTSSESVMVDAFTSPGTNPVTPNGSGIITVTGGQVAAGTTTNVIRTDSLAANTYTIQVQRSQAVATSTIGDNGVSHFNSAQFTVDANGFVSLIAPPTSTSFIVDANTSPGTNPVVPNGSGEVTVTGGQVAAGTTANVIRTDSLAANTYTIQIQRSQAVASSTIGDNGVSHFNSAYFTVDGNGFVSLNTAAITLTLTGNTGGALSPTAGNFNILGISTAAGTTPVTTAGSGSTITIEVQKSQAIASTNATNVGLAAFNSTYFTVDANGFVSINGAAIGETITGNTGGALAPTAGNWNIVGSFVAAGTTPVSTAGTGSTLTVNVQKSQAIASSNATEIGLAAFNSTYFTVDGNGFVSLNGSNVGETLTGNSGGALSPTAGNWNILGASTAAGTTPVTTVGSGSTLTMNVQKAQAIASTNSTNVGLAAFNSADFTVDANGFVSSIASSSGFSSINVQTFATNNVYIPTASMAFCVIECTGGGGGGGGSTTPLSGQISCCGGGGSGGYSKVVASAAMIGASQVVTIGAGGTAGAAGGGSGGNGGTTSVGSICVSTGGQGASGSASLGAVAWTYSNGGNAGSGTSTTSGAINVFGQAGLPGFGSGTAGIAIGGAGGNAFYYGGPPYTANSTGLNGTRGAGGGGGSSNTGTAGQAGGPGGSGIIYITEYIS